MHNPNDPKLTSWLNVAPHSDFPIQNLPYGVFVRSGSTPAVGVALGEHIIDLAGVQDHGLLEQAPRGVFHQAHLNDFMRCGPKVWQATRARVSHLLSTHCAELRDNTTLCEQVIVNMKDANLLLPVETANFVDFYSSKFHASNVGAMFRDPQNPLLPNWLHLPVGYNGRSSSVVVSGQPIHRPMGQQKPGDQDQPVYGPSRLLDYELEVGFYTGIGNELGTRISTANAYDHIFGMVLVNDWSARDIQKWEYVPLGPFLGKSFATTVSPWVVPLAALEPFRVAGPQQEPAVLPYLQCAEPRALDMQLEVHIKTAKMSEPQRIAHTNFKHMYWTMAQQLAHMTVNGTNCEVGDLYASGTVSGPEEHARGCLLEATWGGKNPVAVGDGDQRKFIADGDSIIMRGFCQGNNYRVGFGECEGTILPARD